MHPAPPNSTEPKRQPSVRACQPLYGCVAARNRPRDNPSPILTAKRRSCLALRPYRSRHHQNMIGCWKSDAMLRYLHAQAVPAMGTLARAMFQHATFTFQPSNLDPTNANLILQEAEALTTLTLQHERPSAEAYGNNNSSRFHRFSAHPEPVAIMDLTNEAPSGGNGSKF